MPRYFHILGLFEDHQINDSTLLEAVKNINDQSHIEIFQILINNGIKNSDILIKIVDIINDYPVFPFFQNIIGILNNNKLIEEDLLNQIIEFKQFEKLNFALTTLAKFNILNKKTLQDLMTNDIDLKIKQLTQNFPIKSQLFYFQENYLPSLKWGAAVGTTIGMACYALTSLKILSLSIISPNPLIGATLISVCITLLFLITKICHHNYHQQMLPKI